MNEYCVHCPSVVSFFFFFFFWGCNNEYCVHYPMLCFLNFWGAILNIVCIVLVLLILLLLVFCVWKENGILYIVSVVLFCFVQQ